MLVKLDTYKFHMAGLRLGQWITGTALIEIGCAYLETRTEPVIGCKRAEPFHGPLGDILALGKKDDLTAAVASTHAAAQLMKLSKAEAVGAPDDHRVGARHVEPGFDDVGRE